MTTRIRLRRDTAANWTSANPVLLDAEPGYETDTGKTKIGDGSTTWANLEYSDDRLNQAITSNLIPLTGNLYTVGDVTGQWDTAWLKTLHINNSTFTVIGNVENGTANLTINGANVAFEPYVVNLNSAMSARVNAANAAIVTANTALKNYTDGRFTALVNGAPAVMDTLLEISQSLGNSASFSTTMVNWMANTNANIIAANAATVTANVNMKNYVDARATALAGNLQFVDVTISPKAGASDKVSIATSTYAWQFAANGTTVIPGSILATDASVITSEGDVNLTAADDINIVALGQNITVSANDGIEISAGDKNLPISAPGGNVSISAGNGGSNPTNSDGGIGGTVTIEGGAGGVIASGLNISAATQTNPVQIITASAHGGPQRVAISGAAGMTDINGSWYTTVANTTTLNLYYDSTHSTPLNGNLFSAYTGSGTLTARRRGGDIILSPGPITSGSLPGTIVMNGPVKFADNTVQNTAFYETLPKGVYFVHPTATGSATGSYTNPCTSIADAITAAVTAGHNSSDPAIIVLLASITENVTLAPGVFLTSFGTGTHGSPIITGTITVTSSSGSISVNHYSISNLHIVAPTNGHGILFTGTAPQKLFVRDVRLDANGTGDGIYMDNSGSDSNVQFDVGYLTHSGSGNVYCIDVTDGSCYATGVKTSAATQFAIVQTGAVLTVDGSELVVDGDVVCWVYGNGSLTITNSIITNAKSNSTGLLINDSGGTVTISNNLINIPAGTGYAVQGPSGGIVYHANNVFVDNADRSTALGAGFTALTTAWNSKA